MYALAQNVCSQKEGDLSIANSLQMWMFKLFVAKYFKIFRKLWCIRTDKGFEAMRTKREEVNFSQFCADVFYGRPPIGKP